MRHAYHHVITRGTRNSSAKGWFGFAGTGTSCLLFELLTYFRLTYEPTYELEPLSRSFLSDAGLSMPRAKPTPWLASGLTCIPPRHPAKPLSAPPAWTSPYHIHAKIKEQKAHSKFLAPAPCARNLAPLPRANLVWHFLIQSHTAQSHTAHKQFFGWAAPCSHFGFHFFCFFSLLCRAVPAP